MNTDNILCKSVAESISNIVRFSLNEDFRKESFELFGVNSSKEVEKEINKKLKLILRNKNFVESKTNKDDAKNKITKIINQENQKTSKAIIKKSNSPSDNKLVQKSGFFEFKEHKKNWLQISTNKYKENIKFLREKKFKQCSENTFGSRITGDVDAELKNFDSNIYSSLPLHLTNGSTSFQESIPVLTEAINENEIFLRSKLNKLYKHDIIKYFRKNLNQKNFKINASDNSE